MPFSPEGGGSSAEPSGFSVSIAASRTAPAVPLVIDGAYIHSAKREAKCIIHKSFNAI